MNKLQIIPRFCAVFCAKPRPLYLSEGEDFGLTARDFPKGCFVEGWTGKVVFCMGSQAGAVALWKQSLLLAISSTYIQ